MSKTTGSRGRLLWTCPRGHAVTLSAATDGQTVSGRKDHIQTPAGLYVCEQCDTPTLETFPRRTNADRKREQVIWVERVNRVAGRVYGLPNDTRPDGRPMPDVERSPSRAIYSDRGTGYAADCPACARLTRCKRHGNDQPAVFYAPSFGQWADEDIPAIVLAFFGRTAARDLMAWSHIRRAVIKCCASHAPTFSGCDYHRRDRSDREPGETFSRFTRDRITPLPDTVGVGSTTEAPPVGVVVWSVWDAAGNRVAWYAGPDARDRARVFVHKSRPRVLTARRGSDAPDTRPSALMRHDNDGAGEPRKRTARRSAWKSRSHGDRKPVTVHAPVTLQTDYRPATPDA